MKASRRSLFGWLAGAVFAAPAVAEAVVAPVPAPVEPSPFLGQIRATHAHWQIDGVGTPYSSAAYAVQRYEQWDGSKWVDIGFAPLAAPSGPLHSHTGYPGNHTHTITTNAMPWHVHGITS